MAAFPRCLPWEAPRFHPVCTLSSAVPTAAPWLTHGTGAPQISNPASAPLPVLAPALTSIPGVALCPVVAPGPAPEVGAGWRHASLGDAALPDNQVNMALPRRGAKTDKPTLAASTSLEAISSMDFYQADAVTGESENYPLCEATVPALGNSSAPLLDPSPNVLLACCGDYAYVMEGTHFYAAANRSEHLGGGRRPGARLIALSLGSAERMWEVAAWQSVQQEAALTGSCPACGCLPPRRG